MSDSDQDTDHIVGDRLLSSAGRWLALVGGTSYATGLLIWSMYLGAIGVSDLSLTKPHYLLTGISAYLFLLPPAALLLVLHLVTPRSERSTRVLEVPVIIFFIFAFMTFLLQVLYGGTHEISFGWDAFKLWGIYPENFLVVLLGFCAILAFKQLIYNYRRYSQWEGRFSRSFLVSPLSIIGLVAALLFLRGYSLRIHPEVTPSFGGGAPRDVSVALTKDGVVASVSLKVPELAWRQKGNTKLLYETESLAYFSIGANSERLVLAMPVSFIGAMSINAHLVGDVNASRPN